MSRALEWRNLHFATPRIPCCAWVLRPDRGRAVCRTLGRLGGEPGILKSSALAGGRVYGLGGRQRLRRGRTLRRVYLNRTGVRLMCLVFDGWMLVKPTCRWPSLASRPTDRHRSTEHPRQEETIMAQAPDREKALQLALAQIEKNHGKGSVMRLGDEYVNRSPSSPPDPSHWTSRWASVGCPAAESSRSTARSPRVRPPSRCTRSPTRRPPAASRRSSTPSTRWIPDYAKKLGVDTDALLVSQPDTGEQALEIADMLIKSGAAGHHGHRLGGRAGAACGDRRRDGRQSRRPAGAADEPGAAQDDRRAEQFQHHCDLHQPASREDRRHVRQLPKRQLAERR